MVRKSKNITRTRIGICINEDCELAKSKEKQSVRSGHDFICKKCESELREVHIKSGPNWILIGGVVVSLLILGGSCLFFMNRTPKNQNPINNLEVLHDTANNAIEPVDSFLEERVKKTNDTLVVLIKNEETTVKDTLNNVLETEIIEKKIESSVVKKQETNGRIQLSYGTYTGDVKNGYPHGQGRLTYSKERQINRHDMKKRMAKKGDYVIGEFFNGFVVYGKLYDTNGNVLSSLNFGVGNEDSYDSK